MARTNEEIKTAIGDAAYSAGFWAAGGSPMSPAAMLERVLCKLGIAIPIGMAQGAFDQGLTRRRP